MPLDPSKLARALIQIDAASPKDPVTAASLWTDALVDFTSDLTYLVAPAGAQVGRPVFFAAMMAAFQPVNVWPTFCVAIEAAIRAYLPLVAVPPLISVVGGVYVPSVIPLTPLLIPAFKIGILAPIADLPRVYMAGVIYEWYLTNAILPPSGPPPLPFV